MATSWGISDKSPESQSKAIGGLNRNDVIAPNRSATRSDLLAALLLLVVLEKEILSREVAWRGKDTLILLPSRLPSQTGRGGGAGGGGEGDNDNGDDENEDDDDSGFRRGRMRMRTSTAFVMISLRLVECVFLHCSEIQRKKIRKANINDATHRVVEETPCDVNECIVSAEMIVDSFVLRRYWARQASGRQAGRQADRQASGKQASKQAGKAGRQVEKYSQSTLCRRWQAKVDIVSLGVNPVKPGGFRIAPITRNGVFVKWKSSDSIDISMKRQLLYRYKKLQRVGLVLCIRWKVAALFTYEVD
ncbi:hypothetical protein G5I_10381 [Acromyrmex echinatior]|uniref:Uncharacterized protein n=1 Tax=Acromyrmex echinatior TaxID=103372 RepID=F4WWR1_ACREC|nr:hypothetical protein G5I_10381 [Acromyrmex echinatior]